MVEAQQTRELGAGLRSGAGKRPCTALQDSRIHIAGGGCGPGDGHEEDPRLAARIQGAPPRTRCASGRGEDHCGADVAVTQALLGGTDVVADLKEVSRKRSNDQGAAFCRKEM